MTALRNAAKLPEIPGLQLTKDQQNLGNSLRSIIETLQIREGKKGDILDKNVTLRELLGSGLVKLKPGGGYSINGAINVQLEQQEQVILTKPSKPTGVYAAPGFDTVRIGWDPSSIDYGAHGYAEIWRHTSDNLAAATLVGRAQFFGFVDDVEANTQYFYWVRLVSAHGVPGEYQSTQGVPAKTYVDPGKVLESLENQLTEDQFATSLATRLNGIEDNESNILTLSQVTDDLNVQWSVKSSVNNLSGGIGLVNDGSNVKFYAAVTKFIVFDPSNPAQYSVPFFIEGGNVYMDTALIKNAAITNAHIQTLDVSKITGNKADFIHANIDYAQVGDGVFSGVVQSDNYNGSSLGWRINPDGSVVFNEAVIRGNVYAIGGFFQGDITGATGTFEGSVRAQKIIGDVVTAKKYTITTRTSSAQSYAGTGSSVLTVGVASSPFKRTMIIDGFYLGHDIGVISGGAHVRLQASGSGLTTTHSVKVGKGSNTHVSENSAPVYVSIDIPANWSGNVSITYVITQIGTVTSGGDTLFCRGSFTNHNQVIVMLYADGSDLL